MLSWHRTRDVAVLRNIESDVDVPQQLNNMADGPAPATAVSPPAAEQPADAKIPDGDEAAQPAADTPFVFK